MMKEEEIEVKGNQLASLVLLQKGSQIEEKEEEEKNNSRLIDSKNNINRHQNTRNSKPTKKNFFVNNLFNFDYVKYCVKKNGK